MIKAVILAGGKGVRMGGNKPLTPYGDTTLIEATIARISPQTPNLCINAGMAGTPLAASLSQLGLPLIYDFRPFADLGPLSGVLSALNLAEASGHETVITIPCDMPNLPEDLIARLLEGAQEDSDVVNFKGARDYPLCALWRVSLRLALETALITAAPKGGLAVMRFLNACRVKNLSVVDDAAFSNINTPDAD